MCKMNWGGAGSPKGQDQRQRVGSGLEGVQGKKYVEKRFGGW